MFNEINKNIIVTLGINTLPVEQQKEAMERLGSIIYQEVMIRAIEMLEEGDKDEFEKLIEKDPNPNTMFEFLSKKIPTLNEIVIEEAEKLREESVEIIGDLGK